MDEVRTGDAVIGQYDHGQALGILASARPAAIKALAERVLDGFGDVTVISNRTGLAMLPYQDTVKGTAFHLGEVLVAEAQIEVPTRDLEGYGAVVGRDLEHAMAMAVIDAAIAARHQASVILEFLDAERRHQEESDRQRLTLVEATRVQMETF
ncbi:phosphonate C-P lyase system protein PhnG [Mesorhizobium escarrei]|uniref:Alpha-D-ribose 1-methylphosphonate 5-triphosphate synthase subunit PhnG n=1 Tax=Mesorhizobium escarrei TaxID=666018 RepID=A0ABN8JZ66_9HYPH|nr:phosphonate C-P lyase system protein PhnG [Mesorhizobium escarrei]CAH2402356.1 Alpha-D-ribose 1-methylphosphonate 5-triphosphate synthase subunit PhnG [Mesorhizobium escarrei]